jgi:plasmid stabilization system protein ParE
VFDTIEHFIARHPEAKRPHAVLGLCIYQVSRTPFIVVYDFDAAEVRVHFVLHKSADLTELDPNSAEWS